MIDFSKYRRPFWLAAIVLAIGFGSYLGIQVSADSIRQAEPLVRPTTTDPRHPVAAFFAPLFTSSTEAMLRELKVEVAAEDRVTLQPGTDFGLGGLLVIERALPVSLRDGTKERIVRTWANTVGELIAEQSLELGDKDRVEPARETVLGLDQTVIITRVAIVEVKKKETISYQTKTEQDPSRPKGEKKVLQAGVVGEKILTYQVTRENGKEVGRKLLHTETTKEPVQEIISMGTKPVITGWCKYDNWITDAAAKNGVDPDQLCYRMKRESHGNPQADSGRYKGLFQYDPGFWGSVSAKAGYAGASIWDPEAQVYVTAWAWAHGYRGRWPNP